MGNAEQLKGLERLGDFLLSLSGPLPANARSPLSGQIRPAPGMSSWGEREEGVNVF